MSAIPSIYSEGSNFKRVRIGMVHKFFVNYLQALKNEVQLMIDMVTCLDAFTGQRTRLVVIVDGLDSCEQSKVNSLFGLVRPQVPPKN